MMLELGAVEALELIAGTGCTNFHADHGYCFAAGRTIHAKYSSGRACDACIAGAALETHRNLKLKVREIRLKMEPFTTFASSGFFDQMVSALVDQVVDGGDVEMAIECLDVMDAQRKRLDRVQATPPARRAVPAKDTPLDHQLAAKCTLSCGCSFMVYADNEEHLREIVKLGHWYSCERHSAPVSFDPDDGSVRKRERNQQVVAIRVWPARE